MHMCICSTEQCISLHTNSYIYVCVYTYTNVCCTYTYKHTYTHIYMHAYIHTYTYIHTYFVYRLDLIMKLFPRWQQRGEASTLTNNPTLTTGLGSDPALMKCFNIMNDFEKRTEQIKIAYTFWAVNVNNITCVV